jgi:hypothetical protein
MPRPPIRFTVQRVMLAVALLAFPLADLADRSWRHRERCLEIADHHARIGAEYRRNARGRAGMLPTADRHEFMRAEFERAAYEPWRPIPKSSPFPPKGWAPANPAGRARKAPVRTIRVPNYRHGATFSPTKARKDRIQATRLAVRPSLRNRATAEAVRVGGFRPVDRGS